jgi:cell division ATPase FtsA
MRQFVFGIEYEPDAKDYIRLQNGRLTAFDHSMVEQIITARMSETTDYIREAIHSSGFDYTDKTKLFILGDGFSGMKGNREYLSAKLGFEIESLPLDLTDGTTKFDVSALSLFDYVARQQSTRQPRRFLISPFKQESGGQQYAGI